MAVRATGQRVRAGARVRPLLVRPGARFACSGSGFCCRDLHRLGPLSLDDVARLARLAPGAVVDDADGHGPKLRIVDGHCSLLDGSACSLHREHGAIAKPSICRRFPLGLWATPLGGRVVTSHRCPCRTLGDRPPLSAAEAVRSLRDGRGRLRPDGRTPRQLCLRGDEAIPFAAYAALEAELLLPLARGDYPADVLGLAPELPRLGRGSWREVGASFRAVRARGDAGAEALGWFGDALASLAGDPAVGVATRSWQRAFDEAEARATRPAAAEVVIGDFLADLMWGLHWTVRGSFERFTAELLALWLGALAVTARLVAAGHGAERAAAEAVMITELAAQSGLWWDAVRAFEAVREAGHD
ncbi:MAG: YkgJ family cysteine cluster protein [Myxococcales bacterium]|nr:YkgJ family cysteine cluster protein [Myxococcales bacterium]